MRYFHLFYRSWLLRPLKLTENFLKAPQHLQFSGNQSIVLFGREYFSQRTLEKFVFHRHTLWFKSCPNLPTLCSSHTKNSRANYCFSAKLIGPLKIWSPPNVNVVCACWYFIIHRFSSCVLKVHIEILKVILLLLTKAKSQKLLTGYFNISIRLQRLIISCHFYEFMWSLIKIKIKSK